MFVLLQFQAFQKAMLDGGIELTEPTEVEADYEPGIAYDNQEEVDDLERRQRLVFKLGEKSTLTKKLKDIRRHRGRRRPMPIPQSLEAPSYGAD